MKKHTLTLILVLLYCHLQAQVPSQQSPPFSASGYSVSAENAAVVASNPSALPFQEAPALLFVLHQPALLFPAAVLLAGYGTPLGGRNAVGGYVLQEHWADFRRTEAAVSFAQAYARRFSMALQLAYRSLSYSDAYYGRTQGMDVSLSTYYHPQAPWRFGLVWNNPFGLPFWVAGAQREKIPSSFGVGGSYRWSEYWMTCFEYRKTAALPASVHVGLEAHPFARVQIRTGFEMPFAKADFGIACALPFCWCGLAYTYHPLTGSSIALSLSDFHHSKQSGGRK